MADALSLTLNEAGYVVEQTTAAINRAVDKGIIKANVQRRGKTSFRQIGAPELRYLAIARLVEKDLTPAARKKVYDAVRRLTASEHRLDLGVMELKLAEIDQQIADRLTMLAAIKAHVDESAGEPRLKGTSVPVHVIAGLARAQTVEEIMEDYPVLRREQVVAAIDYAKIYPRTGRPYPQRSFKRMIGELADAGVWELESDAETLEPRTMR